MRRRRQGGISSDDMLEIVGQIYDAALEPATMGAALGRVAGALEAGTGALLIQDRRRGTLVSASLTGIGPSDQAEYGRDWVTQDVGFQQILPGMGPGAVATEQDAPDWRRREIFHGFFHPRGMDHVMGALAIHDGTLLGLIALHRSQSRGPFDAQDHATFRRLLPHLARAGVIQRHLQGAELQRQATLDMLNEIAAELAITRHTVRNHLKQLLAKTGTRRQTELVKLLLSTLALALPANLDRP